MTSPKHGMLCYEKQTIFKVVFIVTMITNINWELYIGKPYSSHTYMTENGVLSKISSFFQSKYCTKISLASPSPHEKFGHISLSLLPDILFNSRHLEHPPLAPPLQKHTSWKNQEACLTCVPLPWWHANTKGQHWFSVTQGRISPRQGLAACARPQGSL